MLQSIVYEPIWGRGFLNNFITISAGLVDVLIVIGIIFLLTKNFFEKKTIKTGPKLFWITLLVFLALALISIFISPYKDGTCDFFLSIKILELFSLYILLINIPLKKEKIVKLFSLAMGAEALLAIFQVIFQKDLGLTILGEPHLSQSIPAIAKITFNGFDFIRGYGTFAHPNVLGGFLVIAILSMILFVKPLKKDHKILITLQSLGLIACFSRSAILALACGLLLIGLYQKKARLLLTSLSIGFTGLILLFINGLPWESSSFVERVTGIKTAIQMILIHPLGVGFNHYTLFLEEILGTALKPWEYQPVHNIFLLIGAEMGIFSLIVLIILLAILIKKTFHQKQIVILTVAIIFLGLFDHYLLTLSQGQFLTIFVFSLAAMSYEGKTASLKSGHPSKN